MLEPPPTDVLTSAVGQQSFEFMIKGLFVYALILFAAFSVLALLTIAAHGCREKDGATKNGR